LLRSADAAGLDAVIIADGGTDLFNPNAIRASRGTIFTVPLCAAAAADVARWLDQHSLQVYVARIDTTCCYDTCDFRRGTAIVLGSEARGVSAIWRDERYQGVRLPMAGHADSLNVAVTGAILFYEALRQRRAE
jgi:TrmH family RNA methyltransferase